MKKFLVWGLCLCAVLLAFRVSIAEAAELEVLTCGEASGADRAAAEQDARYQAVRKAASQLIAVDNMAGSPYQQLLAAYDRYAGKLQVTGQGRSAQGIYLLGRVPVDMDGLRACLQQIVGREQQKAADARLVYFFVRVRGLNSAAEDRRAEQQVLVHYQAAFQQAGFQTADADGPLRAVALNAEQDYAAYRQTMLERLEQSGEVTLAVIGEIDLCAPEQDASGSLVQGRAQLEVRDLVAGKLITSWCADNAIRRRTLTEASHFILDKVALNSARSLAADTLRDWQQTGGKS